MKRYAVVFEKAKSNWGAYVPDLPGCVTTGKTLEPTKHNIREAIIHFTLKRCGKRESRGMEDSARNPGRMHFSGRGDQNLFIRSMAGIYLLGVFIARRRRGVFLRACLEYAAALAADEVVLAEA